MATFEAETVIFAIRATTRSRLPEINSMTIEETYTEVRSINKRIDELAVKPKSIQVFAELEGLKLRLTDIKMRREQLRTAHANVHVPAHVPAHAPAPILIH